MKFPGEETDTRELQKLLAGWPYHSAQYVAMKPAGRHISLFERQTLFYAETEPPPTGQPRYASCARNFRRPSNHSPARTGNQRNAAWHPGAPADYPDFHAVPH